MAKLPTNDAFLWKRRWEISLLLLILVLSFAARITFIHEPFERDEGFYGYIGQEIVRGAIPYRDVIDIKPPGIYYIYAVIIAFLGSTPESVRLVTAVYALATVLSVYLLVRYLYGVRAGLLAALLYGIFSSGPMLQGSSSNTEVFMVLPLVVSAYFFLKGTESKNRMYLSASGFLAGIALLIKTVALPQVLLQFIFLLCIGSPREKAKRVFADLLSYAAPLLLLALGTVAYFTWHGALDDFIYWNFTFLRNYSKSNIKAISLATVGHDLFPELILLLAVAIPTFFWVLFKRRDHRDVFIALLLPAACVGVCMPWKFYPHYFIQLVPFLAILTGIGLEKVLQTRRLLYWTAPLVLLLLVYATATEYKYYFVYTPEEVSTLKYRSNLFVDAATIASYIKKRTVPSDYIFQWGFEPEIYFLSERRATSRYTSPVLLINSRNPEREIRMLTAGIEEKKPKYIVIQPRYISAYWTNGLERIVARDYNLEYISNHAFIYRHR